MLDLGVSGSPNLSGSSPEPENVAFKARLAKFAHQSPTAPSANNPPGSDISRSPSMQSNPSVSKGRPRRKPTDSSLSMQQIETKSHKPISRKRADNTERGDGLEASTPKKRRSTARERSANDPYYPENKLVDSLRPGLKLVFVGLNPGLMTAQTGHAYCHPSNRFWTLLHTSGVTPVKHKPSETHDLVELYSIGNTNICARPSRDGSKLSKEELSEGADILEKKIQELKPQAVAIVGKQIWQALWKARTGQALPSNSPEFKWGWQDEYVQLGRMIAEDGTVTWKGSKTFVTTSTSGLDATLKPAERLAIWKPLGDWFTARRDDLPTPTGHE